MIFLAVKGFGDLTILLNFLNLSNYDCNYILVRKQLYELAIELSPSNTKIIKLESLDDVLPIYNMKKLSFNDIKIMYYFVIEVIKIINTINLNKKESIILDNFRIRDLCLHLFIPIKYLPKTNNIYNSYSEIFGLDISCIKITKDINSALKNNYIAFICGSSDKKTAKESEFQIILNRDKISINNILIYVYFKDVEKVGDFSGYKVKTYSSISELLFIIKNSNTVYSVDTFQMHLAYFFNKKVIPIPPVNKYFQIIELLHGQHENK
jgi:hypothetical protein